MKTRKLFGALCMVAIGTTASVAGGQTPAKFGPVDSRTFHWKAGTAIEVPPANCQSNIDWLLVRGAGVASAKSVDVSPKVSQAFDKTSFPATSCVAPDCLPLFIKLTSRDTTGTRTVTLKGADGRTTTTTFDVVANAGRCDYPKGK